MILFKADTLKINEKSNDFSFLSNNLKKIIRIINESKFTDFGHSFSKLIFLISVWTTVKKRKRKCSMEENRYAKLINVREKLIIKDFFSLGKWQIKKEKNKHFSHSELL